MSYERPALSVTSFGGFSIEVYDPSGLRKISTGVSGGRDGKSKSPRVWVLLAYLILSGKEMIPFEELIEMLWPAGEGVQDPLATLRILIHRARMELETLGSYSGNELIIRQEKAYGWNRLIQTQVDSEQFDALYGKAQKATAVDQVKLLMQAAGLYTGPFLPQASQYQWARVLGTYYHSKYIAVCEEATKLLQAFGRNKDVVDMCKKAIVIDPYAEPLHVAFIKALVELGSYTAAQEHYAYITEMLMDELGVAPSDALKAAYKLVPHSAYTSEFDIGTIRNSLAVGHHQGAFYMDYDVFKHTCELKFRESTRSGQTIQLALISITPAGGKKPGQRSRDSNMERLRDVVGSSLRQGDLFALYSAQQYLALLQSSSYENGRLALQRIERNFRAANPRSTFIVQCKLIPLLGHESFEKASSSVLSLV